MSYSSEDLIKILKELEDTGSPRHRSAIHVAKKAVEEYISPFEFGSHNQEKNIVTLCVFLGIAIRLAEAGSGVTDSAVDEEVEMHRLQDDYEGRYDKDIQAAFGYWASTGAVDEDTMPREGIWWESIIPDAVEVGRSSVQTVA